MCPTGLQQLSSKNCTITFYRASQLVERFCQLVAPSGRNNVTHLGLPMLSIHLHLLESQTRIKQQGEEAMDKDTILVVTGDSITTRGGGVKPLKVEELSLNINLLLEHMRTLL